MAKDCIICGEPAGSKEHVFAAALGGRRINKGIYCAVHNNGFSPLANLLSTQLKTINALLGVRGDHATAPHKTTIVDEPSRLEIALSGGKAEFARPIIEWASAENGIQGFTGRFSSEKQFQEWKEASRGEGLDVKIVSRGSWQEYHPSGGETILQFGGPEGLRAIGYVGQTFLAHHSPQSHAVSI
jgi:hypothetical protein